MDFSNREVKPHAAPVASAPQPAPSKKKKDKGIVSRIGFVAGVVVVVALLIGLTTLFATGDATKNEYKYVDSTKLQAVFLNTGQVYFGNIKSLNNNYLVLANIYYLQTASSGTGSTAANANSNVTLVKLGCELHEPYDQMVINSDQVTFWENLSPKGQVAKAVATFKEQNPEGQKCSDQSSSSSNDSGNSVQSATPNPAKP